MNPFPHFLLGGMLLTCCCLTGHASAGEAKAENAPTTASPAVGLAEWKHWPNSDIKPDAGGILGVAVDRTSGDLFVLTRPDWKKPTEIWRSTDQARSFTKGKTDGITGGYLYGRSYAFSFAPAGKKMALFPIMGNGGTSTDGGLTWIPFVQPPDAKALPLDCGVVDWEDTGKTCFGLWHEHGGNLVLSSDSGATWKIIGEKFLSPLGIFDAKTLVAVKDGALHRSTDGGVTWTKGDAFREARYNRIQTIITIKGVGYLLTPQGLKMSKDKGETWTLYGSPVNISGTQEYWPNGPFFGTDEMHCVLIGWDGVFQTADGGAHWKKVAPFPAEWPVPPAKGAGGAIFAWDPIHNIIYGCCGKTPALYCQLPAMK